MVLKKILGVMLSVTVLLLGAVAVAQEDEIIIPVDDPFVDVVVSWEELQHTNNNVLIPTVSGLADAEVMQIVNTTMLERLPIEEAKAALERAESWGDEPLSTPEIQMSANTYRKENLLSISVSVWGMLGDSFDMHRYYTFNFDLLSGYEIPLASLFQNSETAFAQMEQIISQVVAEDDFNTYASSTQVLPMPQDNYSVTANGLTVYYPASQYAHISGTAGSFRFLYYELEALLAPDNAISALLSGNIQRPAETAQQIHQDALDGKLLGIPVTLRGPLQQYLDSYRPVSEPDYTLEEALYQFEEPRMQQAMIGSEKFLDDADDASVTSIRAGRMDQYGLRPGTSTLDDVAAVLGEPDASVEIDAATAENRMLVSGQSYLYVIADEGGERENVTLEYVADETGILYRIILRVN